MIVKTEGILGGKPRVDGTRISVLDIVELLEIGYSMSETANQVGITEKQVEAAARYSRQHPVEMATAKRRRRQTYESI